MSQKDKTLKLKIEKLSYGGAGIARSDGKVIFVRRGLPGDVVEAGITRNKKSFSMAEMKRILSPSDKRVRALCPVFGKCGGCQWQDLDYEAQLIEKGNIVSESIRRIGKIEELHPEPVVPSPLEYGYRSRIVLSVIRESNGFSASFFEEGTENKIPVDNCPVAGDSVNSGIECISDFLKKDKRNASSINRIYVASGDHGTGITVLMRVNEKKVKRILDSRDLKLSGGPETEISLVNGGKKFLTVPSIFMQSNNFISRIMTDTLVQWLDESGADRVLDLYSGFGNFTLPACDIAGFVKGVDSDALAIKYARRNSELNGCSNTEFTRDNASAFLEKNRDYYDTVILDPPREGAKDCLGYLAEMKPETIVYISCDPVTLSRDLASLYSYGYRAKTVKPFDMFPHTYHIECMVLLELKDRSGAA